MSQAFKLALPDNDVKTVSDTGLVLGNLLPSPKIDTTAQPPHTGIIFLNWATTGIILPNATIKVIYSFPHNYGYVPSVIASYKFDNGSVRPNGVLPLSIGALGLIIMDADITNINLKYISSDISAGTPIPPFLLQARFYVMAERGVGQ